MPLIAMLFLTILLLPALVVAEAGAPQCTELIIPASVSAQNKQFPAGYNISKFSIDDQTAYNDLITLPETTVGGDYAIAARYCEPTKVDVKRAQTLQLLVHGIVYNKNYWSGLFPPGQSFNGSEYSWVDYAAKEGYPTLAVDRICSGDSSKPNGLLACQIPLNAETLYAVIQAARAGKVAGRKFEKVVYIGHSLGSVIGNFLALKHPGAVEGYVLTGFSSLLSIGALGTVIAGGFIPAMFARPTQFATLADPTYLFGANTAGTKGLVYYKSYTEELFQVDRQTQGTTTAGEFATALLGQALVRQYTGPLMALNDQNDQIFCARSPLDPLAGYRGDCGSGDASYTAQVARLYPNAKTFTWKNIPATGHSINYHYTAQQTFKAAHDFLARQGF